MNDLIRSGPYDLQVVEDDRRFVLCFQGDPVLTSKGEQVSHHTPHLLQHMIEEFDHQGDIAVRAGVIEEPKCFSAYALYGIQKDWIQKGEEELSTQFAAEIVRDGMLFRCAGPEVTDQWYRWGPVLEYLSENDLELPNLAGPFMDDPEMYGSEEEFQEAKDAATPDPDFVAKVSELYQALTEAQRSVVMYLHAIHGGVVLFPLVLALGRCNPNEYASGVIATQAMIGGVFSDVSSEDHKTAFASLKEDARTALDYLNYFKLPVPKRVFVSHSSQDRDFVEREVIDLLHNHGINTWYSTDDILTASQWQNAIVDGLESCDWFLVVLSPRSITSNWVRAEVNWALANREDLSSPLWWCQGLGRTCGLLRRVC